MPKKGSSFHNKGGNLDAKLSFPNQSQGKAYLYPTAGSTDRVISRWENSRMQEHLYLCSVLRTRGTRAQLLEFWKHFLEDLPSKVSSTWFCCNFRLETKGINFISPILPLPLSLPPHTSNSPLRERSQKCTSKQAFWL